MRFYCSEPQFCDHLAPLSVALPLGLHEGLYVDDRRMANRRADELRLNYEIGRGAIPGDGQVVVASYVDELAARGRPICLLEHGAGQNYGPNDITPYVAAVDRDAVELYLCPNQTCADARAHVFPHARIAVVGCPKLDPFHLAGPKPMSARPVVAFTWHWPCSTWPESKSAWAHYRRGFATIVQELRAAGCDVIGHGHPRFIHSLRRWYRTLDIPVVERLSQVFELADIFVCDNSSAMFEAASIGIPVVVLNCPDYRRSVNHGLRFWDKAGIGPNCSTPSEVVPAISDVLSRPGYWRGIAQDLVDDVYVYRGTATKMAVEALVEWAS